jgi:hypothetical protein
MVFDLAHFRWQKKLLELRLQDVIYHIISDTVGIEDVFFMYREGIWEFLKENSKNVDKFESADLAANYLTSIGINNYTLKMTRLL